MNSDRFTYRDVTQTLRAFKAAGVPIARVEIYRDSVIVVPGDPSETPTETDEQDRESLERFKDAFRKTPRRRPR